jgi:beta-barrel assembly-enhancing protease
MLCTALAWPAQAGGKKKDASASRDADRGVNLYSPEREAALGHQLAREVERQARLVEDPIISEYVNRVGQNLARSSDARFPFTFKVIEDDSVNAFALPGGYVFINSGLVEVSEDENELAAVLAHEIGHVAARHMTRQATRGQLANLIGSPLASIAGGLAGAAARQAAALAIPLTFAHFDRESEAEADTLGVRYLFATGYDPSGMVSIFEKMEALKRRKTDAISSLFTTHPPDVERIRKAQQEIAEAPAGRDEFVISTSQYAAIRERLIALRNAREDRAPAAKPTLKSSPAR